MTPVPEPSSVRCNGCNRRGIVGIHGNVGKNVAVDLADVGEERATPHRFQAHVRAILLQRGVPVADVADLIGDDKKTVREHYARWVPERQARLRKILKDVSHQAEPQGDWGDAASVPALYARPACHTKTTTQDLSCDSVGRHE